MKSTAKKKKKGKSILKKFNFPLQVFCYFQESMQNFSQKNKSRKNLLQINTHGIEKKNKFISKGRFESSIYIYIYIYFE